MQFSPRIWKKYGRDDRGRRQPDSRRHFRLFARQWSLSTHERHERRKLATWRSYSDLGECTKGTR